MKYNNLGKTNIKVSEICLGSMNWGEQNTQKEAHEQIDYALDQGINFIDVAEMYPVPPSEETYGNTERIIGQWISKNSSRRENFVLATKIAGPTVSGPRDLSYLRNGPRLDKKNIREAITNSLKRLKTDYIDLYQIHWPERKVNIFGCLDYCDEWQDIESIEILETLQVLDELVKEGLVRNLGLSNETPWGMMQYLSLAEKHGLTRMATIQNVYNLLNRSYEIGLAEVSLNEQCSLLVYSPLAFGVLSGKYNNGTATQNSRLIRYKAQFGRYLNERGNLATQEYIELAKKHNISLAQLSIAFTLKHRYVASSIIGATTIKQLKENIKAKDISLNEQLIQELNEIHAKYPNPCP